jgi:hypothetical protein
MKFSTSTRLIAAMTLVGTMSACMASAHAGGGGGALSISFITREPPAERVEVVSARPYDDAVWIGGHWSARGNEYAWVSGRWERPVSGKKEWVAGRWEHEDRGWHYTEGFWR